MKVDWLNATRTAAAVTRGVLWWRRRAYVESNGGTWRYMPSRMGCPQWLSTALGYLRYTESLRDAEREEKANWLPLRRRKTLPPKARVRRLSLVDGGRP